MKNFTKIFALTLLTIAGAVAQNKKENQMEKRITNPWKWQDSRNYVQAVEVKNVQGTLYVSGQTAIEADGKSSAADMRSQLILTLQNLEKVIQEAGYDCKNIVRLNIYTTSTEELFPNFDLFQAWTVKHGMNKRLHYLRLKAFLKH